MRFQRIGPVGAERPVVTLHGQTWDLSPFHPDIDPMFFETEGPSRAAQWVADGRLQTVSPSDERVGAPLAAPRKIVCIGLNYRDHAAESAMAVPDEPVVFLKDPATVVGPTDSVHLPPDSSRTDWEVELGVVIGRTARYLSSPTDAPSHVAGFVVSNDLSEREYQLDRGGQWDKGKCCETFNPLGPALVTPDEIQGLWPLTLSLSVNGEVRQESTTDQMVFGVDHIIWYLSQFMVLRPGDLINTGTPAGVALGGRYPYLTPGDVVECTISGLGTLRQDVVRATREPS